MSMLTDLKRNKSELAVSLIGITHGIACLEDAHKKLQDALDRAFPIKEIAKK